MKKSQSPLKKLNKDVEAIKGKKAPVKEEAKKNKEEAKTNKEEAKKSSKTVPGHDFKTQPKKPTGSYLLFNAATTKRLK